ncbi:MAG: hypothetical protein C0613_11925 [Desulfobulbaceae bacterium]|nr:MAG: hypothetical protein C0613_11925 [Desulfobulbaceae bacterium]
MTDRQLIPDNNTLFHCFQNLGNQHCFVGRLRLKAAEEFLLHDLEGRGVLLFPSGLSQLLARSKVAQARLLGHFMVPLTMAVFDHHELLEAVNRYGRHQIGPVITKADRKNGGQGINKWSSIEDVFNQAGRGALAYPFVLQPFFADAADIRVICLDDYQESYTRHNPDNFRNNLHCGGVGKSVELSEAQQQLCRAVMERGAFPYGHIDLLVSSDGASYLSEINLRGGLRGARIKGARYQELVDRIHRDFIRQNCIRD